MHASKLYSLLMEEMAHGAQAGFYNARPLNSSALLDDLKPDYKATMAQWSSGDFLALTGQIGRLSPKKKRTIVIVAKVNPCLFHSHVTTPPCKSLKRKREDEGTVKCLVYDDYTRAGGNLSGEKVQTVESIEDEYSTVQDSPTRKRKRSRSAKTSTSSGEENVAKEQGKASQDIGPTQAGGELECYATLAEERKLTEDETHLSSPASNSTISARSQTIAPDSPHVQVASSDIDPSEHIINSGEESDTPQHISRTNPVVIRQTTTLDYCKDDPALNATTPTPAPAPSPSPSTPTRCTTARGPTQNLTLPVHKRRTPPTAAHHSMPKTMLRRLRYGV